MASAAAADAIANPYAILSLWFIQWKLLLLAVIFISPGPGYDTSTTLLPDIAVAGPVTKLVRWDVLYFLASARRGYVYEQEWAFSYPFARLLAVLTPSRDGAPDSERLALTGIVLAHVCHYVSVLLLYALTSAVFGTDHHHHYRRFGPAHERSRLLPLLTAALHVLSPAGVFLSAPYIEPLFSVLNFAGFLVYVHALAADRAQRTGVRDAAFVVAGLLFALATAVRSNGLLSGLLFAYDAIENIWKMVMARRGGGVTTDTVRRLVSVFVGGSLIFIAFAVPQCIAYTLYCRGEDGPVRGWCHSAVPSIYGFVQRHYWNVGFLRYWTLLNLPLFLLAMPVLALLIYSSFRALTAPDQRAHQPDWLYRLALPQALLAVLAVSTYHVQIINRIASGYPLWYWYLASQLRSYAQPKERSIIIKPAVYGIVLYALIQGTLFASFLPPA